MGGSFNAHQIEKTIEISISLLEVVLYHNSFGLKIGNEHPIGLTQRCYHKPQSVKSSPFIPPNQVIISLTGGAVSIGNRNIALSRGAVFAGREIYGNIYIGKAARNDKELSLD